MTCLSPFLWRTPPLGRTLGLMGPVTALSWSRGFMVMVRTTVFTPAMDQLQLTEKCWYSPCVFIRVFSGLCRICEQMPLDEARSQSPGWLIYLLIQFLPDFCKPLVNFKSSKKVGSYHVFFIFCHFSHCFYAGENFQRSLIYHFHWHIFREFLKNVKMPLYKSHKCILINLLSLWLFCIQGS